MYLLGNCSVTRLRTAVTGVTRLSATLGMIPTGQLNVTSAAASEMRSLTLFTFCTLFPAGSQTASVPPPARRYLGDCHRRRSLR